VRVRVRVHVLVRFWLNYRAG